MEMKVNRQSYNASIRVLFDSICKEFESVKTKQVLRVVIYTASTIFDSDAIERFIDKALVMYEHVEICFSVIENPQTEEFI
jgi:hypothetical protein